MPFPEVLQLIRANQAVIFLGRVRTTTGEKYMSASSRKCDFTAKLSFPCQNKIHFGTSLYGFIKKKKNTSNTSKAGNTAIISNSVLSPEDMVFDIMCRDQPMEGGGRLKERFPSKKH